MVNKSPRELLAVPAAWSITDTMVALERALEGDGPALAFGPSNFGVVDPDIAVVIPTSGSSGHPKEVALTAQALHASTSAAHQYLQAEHGQRWSLLLPTNHIAGVNVLLRALSLGTKIVESNFDFTSIVPTQLYRALNQDQDLLNSLKNAQAVLVGGAATNSDLLDAARSAGINVVTTYGMTEMSGGCIYNNRPLAGVEIQIRADERIALRGPMQAKQYLGIDESFIDPEKWFLTNDAGYIKDGKLFVTGRIDDLIISGGEKVSLEALDSFLITTFQSDFMSCAISNPEWGQSLCLAAANPFDKEEVKQALRTHFGNQAVPKLFLENLELPHTSLGKPDRQKLAARFEMMRL